MTIKVGFDFDEPIYKWYDFAHQASLRAGLAQPHHNPTSWAPHEHYGCTLEEWVAVLDAEILHGDMYHQPFDPGAMAAIKRLYSRGYEIHIITARGQFGEMGEKVKEITRSEIIKQGLPYNTLTFAKDKVPVALELGLDYFLDDAPHNFDPLVEAGVNTYLLDERWNRDHPEKFRPEGRRVHSTKEYCDMIMDTHFRQNEISPKQRRRVNEEIAGIW